MKKRIVLGLMALTVSTVALAQSQFIRKEVRANLVAWGFSAPEVSDKTSIVASTGDITIETVGGVSTFYGYTGAGGWKSLQATSNPANSSVRSVTSTDTCSPSDDILILSGASFTETIFTAVGNEGKVLTLVHGGTSLSQVYTLNTTSGQTIGGLNSGDYKLYTNGEKLKLVSNGSHWLVIGHDTETAETDAGALTITGSTTNPTMPTGVNYHRFVWHRKGKYVFYRWEASFSNNGSVGSGDYSATLPTGLTAETNCGNPSVTCLTTNATVIGAAYPQTYATVGAGRIKGGGLNLGAVSYLGTSTTMKVIMEGAGVFGSAAGGMSTTPTWSISGFYPVSGWQP